MLVAGENFRDSPWWVVKDLVLQEQLPAWLVEAVKTVRNRKLGAALSR